MSKVNQKPAAAAAPQVATVTPIKSPSGGGGGSHKSGPSGKKDTVVTLPGMCMADSCKQKSQKANFCMEHFDWFKEGLITKEGHRPTDFDKKHFDYQRRREKRAA